jgi:phosphoglycerate dehydrogenase-like enzyme
MTTPGLKYNLLIASYLEPEYVARIQALDPRLTVLYEPALLPPPRYPSDHIGAPFTRSPEQEATWRGLLAQADIMFDFDYTHRQELPDLAPRVRWIQATSAGIGQYVKRYGYDTRMPNTIFTTASGVHARPLAEFCIMAILMHNKGARRMWHDQQRHHWERYAGTDLEGRTLALVGLGRIGSAVARAARCLSMKVIGTDIQPNLEVVDRYYPPEQLHEMLPHAEYLVLAVPHTPATEGMIGAEELALLPKGAYFINIARGAVVDEAALIAALQTGHLSGAALDVFAVEPLPADSPLWDMPHVLISPHSASTSDRENQRLTDLFCDNLQRFLAGLPLRNVLDTQRMY